MIPFANTYSQLPAHFHARTHPHPVADPTLIALNTPLAEFLQIDPQYLASPEGLQILAGNQVAHGSEPLAIAYAGHQFGHFVPALGDGRANLLGEVRATDGKLYDLQLKGSGPTPFSRRGDGRSALGPVLREYLVSEAMHALGVPTTRALAAVASGEHVQRETPEPGGVFTRVAASHLRVGTFQYFAAKGDHAALKTLADYAIERHYPGTTTYLNFLEQVIARHATLVAQWVNLGFIHGVMNTDNTSISGQTLDYGPCAFMEQYIPAQVFSSIDRAGRYAYENQPNAAQWNLARLAETLLPLLASNQDEAIAQATAAINAFPPQYEAARTRGLLAKIGLTDPQHLPLAEQLLTLMHTHQLDFTQTFTQLTEIAKNPAAPELALVESLAFETWVSTHPQLSPLTDWLQLWLAEQPSPALMQQANPAVIPRNHQVQAVIDAAYTHDYAPFHALLAAITQPQIPNPAYTQPATPNQRVTATFCGT